MEVTSIHTNNKTVDAMDSKGESDYFVLLSKMASMLEADGNLNFVTKDKKPTEELATLVFCIYRFRSIGIALNNLKAPIVPDIVSWCDYILLRENM